MSKTLDLMRSLYYAVRLGMDPEDTERVFKLTGAVRDPALKSQVVNDLKAIPEIGAVLAEKPTIPRLRIERLKACAPGTLGAETLAFLEKHGLDPTIFPDYDESDTFDYFRTRMGHTHDIRHVLLGVGPDVAGEIVVQAFDLAQIRQPLPAIIIAVAMMRVSLTAPPHLPTLLEAITSGYALGKRAANLFPVDFSEYYDQSLDEVRRALRVEPVGRLSSEAA